MIFVFNVEDRFLLLENLTDSDERSNSFHNLRNCLPLISSNMKKFRDDLPANFYSFMALVLFHVIFMWTVSSTRHSRVWAIGIVIAVHILSFALSLPLSLHAAIDERRHSADASCFFFGFHLLIVTIIFLTCTLFRVFGEFQRFISLLNLTVFILLFPYSSLIPLKSTLFFALSFFVVYRFR